MSDNPYSPSAQPMPPARPSPVLSILSLIGGIVGVVLACCWGAGFLFAVAGVILGHIALKKEPHGRGMAIAGLITGYVGAGISVIFFLLTVFSIVAPLAFLPFASM